MGDSEKEKIEQEEESETVQEDNELKNYESQIQKFQELLAENEGKFLKARAAERDSIQNDITFCEKRLDYYREQREKYLSTPKIVFPPSSVPTSVPSTPLSSRFFQPPSAASSSSSSSARVITSASLPSSSSSSSSSSGVFETPALSLPSASPFALTSSKGEKSKENEKGMNDPVAKASIDVKVKGSKMPTLVVNKSTLVGDYLRWRVSAKEAFKVHHLPLDVIKIYLRSMLPSDVMNQVSKSTEYARGDLDEIFSFIQEIVLGPRWRCLLSDYERKMCKGRDESYTTYVFRAESVWKEIGLNPLSTDESYCSRALGRGLDRFGREFLELGGVAFGGGGYIESRRLCVSLDTNQAFHSYRDLALLKWKDEEEKRQKKKKMGRKKRKIVRSVRMDSILEVVMVEGINMVLVTNMVLVIRMVVVGGMRVIEVGEVVVLLVIWVVEVGGTGVRVKFSVIIVGNLDIKNSNVGILIILISAHNNDNLLLLLNPLTLLFLALQCYPLTRCYLFLIIRLLHHLMLLLVGVLLLVLRRLLVFHLLVVVLRRVMDIISWELRNHNHNLFVRCVNNRVFLCTFWIMT